jgi:hypothetical protein
MLSLSEILEVAIGLIFVWIVVSVAVMQTQEWIVGWLSIRADGLEESIWGMLADPKRRRGPIGRAFEQVGRITRLYVPQAPAVVKELYDHPMIKGLAQQGKKPSYIPADKFAAALFDVVMTAGKAESAIARAFDQLDKNLDNLKVELSPEQVEAFGAALDRLLKTEDGALPGAYRQFKVSHPRLGAKLEEMGVDENDAGQIRTALQNLNGRLRGLKLTPAPEDVSMVRVALKEVKGLSAVTKAFDQLRKKYPHIGPVLDALEPALDEFLQADPPDNETQMMAQIVNGAAALATSYPGLQRALDGVVANARVYATQTGTAIALARTNVETWFDDTMERANGWYKRNRQVGAFVIALFFAAIINIDSVDVGIRLWREPTLRRAVAAQAELYKLPAEGEAGTGGPQDLEALQGRFSDLQQSLSSLQIPIGWESVPVKVPEGGKCTPLQPIEDTGIREKDAWGFWLNGQCQVLTASNGYLSKLAGLIITAAAATLGAPFWFDILQKLIGIRSAGGKPLEPGGQGGPTKQ